jgi:hypothetical protein
MLDAFGAIVLASDASFEPFSRVGVFAPLRTLPKSRALLGGFEGFTEPKDAKAPEPNPNALEAPALGVVIVLAGDGSGLKAFDFPCEVVSPPCRFEVV